ncbi:hypothetical protein BD324DRAFT_621950 [Kockovaella imperatae]|uniref:Uncharacterized protein n=1 Tax=Kockovaella imperatae TaxID=4999 RepID=A0A1Y1UL25_9TREE|nr:hypothetical protein BD324DRAFT_621950 [Kockovaella imperatae]ORX38689.1 hypothetical protein BD324DRAFT_621950 [Kockovaella imperatae]
MPKVDPDAKIQCPDAATLQIEIDILAQVLDLGEREDTWEKLEKGLIRFAGVTRGGGYKHLPLFVDALGRGRGRTALGPQVVACVSGDLRKRRMRNAVN